MNQRFKIVLFSLIIVAIALSCDDIIERQLDDKVVKIITPADKASSTDYNPMFWWEELEGVDKYELQIVKNRFDSLPEFELDSFTTKNKMTVTLAPGLYQWKVIAINGSSRTKSPSIQTLRIRDVGIVGQDIIVTTPQDNYLINNPIVTFKWEQLAGAKEYVFEIAKTSSFSNQELKFTKTTSAKEIQYTFINDSTYYWRVTAKNKEDYSNPSDIRKITIDRKSPNAVTLVSPAHNGSVSNVSTTGAEFKWEASSDDDISHYKIYFYKDDKRSESVTGYPLSTKSSSNPTALTHNFKANLTSGTFYWEVRAVDKAENEGPQGDLRSFTIK